MKLVKAAGVLLFILILSAVAGRFSDRVIAIALLLLLPVLSVAIYLTRDKAYVVCSVATTMLLVGILSSNEFVLPLDEQEDTPDMLYAQGLGMVFSGEFMDEAMKVRKDLQEESTEEWIEDMNRRLKELQD